MPTLTVAELPPRVPTAPIIIVDPGRKCGTAVIPPAGPWEVGVCDLDDLPFWLATACALFEPAFIGVEDYSMTGGQRANDPKMPSAIGIGMVRAVGMFAETHVVLLPRGTKRAGHQALDEFGFSAFHAARNDHQRDVVDLGGFCLRELRTREHNAKLRP